jgi:hypothetical protein
VDFDVSAKGEGVKEAAGAMLAIALGQGPGIRRARGGGDTSGYSRKSGSLGGHPDAGRFIGRKPLKPNSRVKP